MEKSMRVNYCVIFESVTTDLTGNIQPFDHYEIYLRGTTQGYDCCATDLVTDHCLSCLAVRNFALQFT
jgi:hypothetical protein